MGEKLWTREFIGMGLTNFFYFMSQYIMIAALPVYIMDDLGLGEWEAGMAMTCFQIGTVVSRPLAGRVIDAVNKQRLLLIVSVLLFLLMTGFLLAYRLEIALSLRLIHGIVFALGTTASAAMAALVLPSRRKGEGIGYFAVCGNMAMVVGPLVGLILIEHFGASVLFLFLSLMAACAIVSGNGKRLPARVVCPSGETHRGFHFSDFFEKKALSGGHPGRACLFCLRRCADIHSHVHEKPWYRLLHESLLPRLCARHRRIPSVCRLSLRSPWLGLYGVSGLPFLLGGLSPLLAGRGTFPPAPFRGGAGDRLRRAGACLPDHRGQQRPFFRAGVATSTYFWSLDISVGFAAAFLGLFAEAFGYSFMYGGICLASSIAGAVYYFVWRRGKQMRN